MSPPPDPLPSRPWQRFQRAHLFDYHAGAARAWLLVLAAGTAALLWALLQLPLRWDGLWPLLLGLALVAVSACFPVQLPRTTFSLGIADVVIFTLLAAQGPAAAVLAAGTEGIVATLRTSRRLSSWLISPATAMASMALASQALQPLRTGLALTGLGEAGAALAALCLTGLLHFALTTLTLTRIVTLKRQRPLDLAEWWQGNGWLAAIYLASAALAGVVALNARQFGAGVWVVGVLVTFGVVALLRWALARQAREHAEQELRIADAQREAQIGQQRFRAAFSHAAIGMAIVDARGRILQANQALSVLFGVDAAQLQGRDFEQHLHVDDLGLFRSRMGPALVQPDPGASLELRCRRLRDGNEIWVALHGSPFEDPGDTGTGLIYQLRDISLRRRAESQLQHIAYHDTLTGLVNRHGFRERLDRAIGASRTDPAQRFAVMFLDLDRFKVVNDSLGHSGGNRLLCEVARRLRDAVRPQDLVARLGGDEFALLLEAVGANDDAEQLARRVLEAMSQPVAIAGTEVLPGASIGITFSDIGYRGADEVLRDADLAMYEAKAAGRGRAAVYDRSMHDRIADKLALEADLRHAIGAGELSVVFQPLVRLDGQQPYGFEALARWTHPARGVVSPAVFIALAEEAGHIEALTAWVIDHACARLASWQRSLPGMASLGLHVNVSGRDLASPGLVDRVQATLARHRLDARQLTLEITETTLMSRLDVALQALSRLRELGVGLSIDDFGTGYSSLAYLSTLPIDSLKIDRSFVMGLHEKPQNREIVRAVLDLGRSLGKKVIAEGIETEEQLATLRRMGVPIGQGYLLSRPLAADQVAAWLAQQLLEPA